MSVLHYELPYGPIFVERVLLERVPQYSRTSSLFMVPDRSLVFSSESLDSIRRVTNAVPSLPPCFLMIYFIIIHYYHPI
jgi:hypothetical protein